MRGYINTKQLQKEILNHEATKRMVQKIAIKEVEIRKYDLIQKFENHLVTKELESGPSATNISNTLNGYGNLFSFIGFENEAKPTQPVSDLLEKIKINKDSGRVKNNIFTFDIIVPSLQDFGAVSKMPWENGRSWLLDMEKSISGLGAYIYGKFSQSRSSTGIQTRKNYSGRSFKSVKYFTTLLEQFLRSLKK
jgi:hypothetical protein